MKPHAFKMARLAAFAVAAAVSLAPAAASAQTTTTTPRRGARAEVRADDVAAIKARCDAQVDRRLATIADLERVIDQARDLTGAHRGTLHQLLAGDRSGLQALRAKIDADGDAATLRSDCHKIVTDYRIYVLVAPKVRLVIAADRVAAIAARFDQLAPKVQSRIDAAKARGQDVTALQSALDDAKAKVADARSKTAGLADQVLALDPGGYPGNRSTLQSARQAMFAARQELLAARNDLRRIVSQLEASSATTTTA